LRGAFWLPPPEDHRSLRPGADLAPVPCVGVLLFGVMPANGKLNARQEAFARGLAEGKSQRQAYIAAGYDSKDKVADECASQVLANPKVRERVAELQAKVAERTVKTVESLVANLDEAIAMARELKQPRAMIDGIMGQGKLLGLVIDRAQVEAIVRRPAPDPDARPGVILSEADWQRRIELKANAEDQEHEINGSTA
jgi:hypothetical protein